MTPQRTAVSTAAVVFIVVIIAAAGVGVASYVSQANTTTNTTTSTQSTSISTGNSSAISTVTDTLIQTTTLNQTVTTTITSAANSTVTVDSADQSGETIAGNYTLLGGINGSLVAAEGFTPDTLTITVGQTYSVRAEGNGSCTFSGWSDGVTNDTRTFTATSGPLSYTAVYSCGNESPTSAIFQSCTGYYPTIGTVTQTQTQTATTTATGTEPVAQTVRCTMSDDVRAGDLIVVKISDLSGINFSDSMGNAFTLLETDPVSSTYYNFIYYTIASSSGPDTLTVQGYGNYPSIMATELQGLHTISSYEVATGDSNVTSVGAFTPANGSFVMAFVEALGPPISVSAGAGYTVATVYAVSNACEYGTVSGPTTSSFTLGASADWEEVSLVFS